MEYEGRTIRRWNTPISDVPRLLMVSLTDFGGLLEIVFEAMRDDRERWKARFKRYGPYRNTDERHLCELWAWQDSSSQRCGSTFVIEDSSWAQRLWEGRTLHHYVLSTMDDVVEVIAEEAPEWEALGSAPPRAPIPGKSEHLFLSEDGEAIARLTEDIQRRKRGDDGYSGTAPRGSAR